MTGRDVTALAEELGLPPEVLEPLGRAAETLPPEVPYEKLASPETAEGAWAEITARLPAWEEDGGMAQLAAALARAARGWRTGNGVSRMISFWIPWGASGGF